MDLAILIPIVSSIITAVISYLAATNKNKSEIERSKIDADKEIEKIRESSKAELEKFERVSKDERLKIEEQYKRDLEKMKVETDEKVRLLIAEKELEQKEKNDELSNDFVKGAIKNPKEAIKSLEGLGDLMNGLTDLQKKFPNSFN